MITKKGTCPVCAQVRTLTRAGTMRFHLVPLDRSKYQKFRAECDGTGQASAAEVPDPIAAAEARGYAKAVAVVGVIADQWADSYRRGIGTGEYAEAARNIVERLEATKEQP